jgi:hypothetical protein
MATDLKVIDPDTMSIRECLLVASGCRGSKLGEDEDYDRAEQVLADVRLAQVIVLAAGGEADLPLIEVVKILQFQRLIQQEGALLRGRLGDIDGTLTDLVESLAESR